MDVIEESLCQVMYVIINMDADQPSNPHSALHGFKFVGDNIDKTIQLWFERHNKGIVSLHYFQGYALKDRVDISHLLHQRPSNIAPDSTIFLPFTSELNSLKEEMAILFARLVSSV